MSLNEFIVKDAALEWLWELDYGPNPRMCATKPVRA